MALVGYHHARIKAEGRQRRLRAGRYTDNPSNLQVLSAFLVNFPLSHAEIRLSETSAGSLMIEVADISPQTNILCGVKKV